MRRMFALFTLAVGLAAAQGPPIASSPIVEIKGKIARVQITPGQGMPFLEVEDGERTTRVFLGSMRYLMQNNFNPKAGAAVEVKGYKSSNDLVAITVSLPDEKKTLRLRDDSGRPLWRGGRGNRWGARR